MYKDEETIRIAKAYIHGGYKEQGRPIPTVPGLGLCLGVTRKCLHDWARKHPDFSEVYDELIKTQEDLLLAGGLDGKFNATITKLVLSARHEYREKTAVEQSGPGGGPVQHEVIAVDGLSDDEVREAFLQRMREGG